MEAIENPGSFNDFCAEQGLPSDEAVAVKLYSGAVARYREQVVLVVQGEDKSFTTQLIMTA